MAEDNPKGGAKALVSSILSQVGDDAEEPPAAPAVSEPTPAADPDEEATSLVEVYFELEEPEERDALFDQLIRIDSNIVTDFLRVLVIVE